MDSISAAGLGELFGEAIKKHKDNAEDALKKEINPESINFSREEFNKALGLREALEILSDYAEESRKKRRENRHGHD